VSAAASGPARRPGAQGLAPADVTVVVRAFNESSSLATVLTSLVAAGFRIVVVDDGSTDGSAAIAAAQGVEVVRHARNLGAGAALATGLLAALATPCRAVACFDADLQHRVADLRACVDRLAAGDVDLVFGSRFLRRADWLRVPLRRRWLLRGAVVLHRWLTGAALTDAHNGLRIFRREAAARIRISEPGYAYASELLLEARRLDLRIAEVPATVDYSRRSLAKGQRDSGAVSVAGRALILAARRWTALPGEKEPRPA
jgi:glycosyltransferase involved in cell wall biosynthesis